MTDNLRKLYYSIKEVAQMIGVSESLLRYWETEFPHLRPKTTGNRVRQYTDKDIEQTLKAFSETKAKLDKGEYKVEAIPDMAEAR